MGREREELEEAGRETAAGAWHMGRSSRQAGGRGGVGGRAFGKVNSSVD